MKKKLALLLACSMMMGLTACGGKTEAPATTAAPAATEAAKEETEAASEAKTEEAAGGMDALIEAAKAEGELTVYGSCEEEYLLLPVEL